MCLWLKQTIKEEGRKKNYVMFEGGKIDQSVDGVGGGEETCHLSQS